MGDSIPITEPSPDDAPAATEPVPERAAVTEAETMTYVSSSSSSSREHDPEIRELLNAVAPARGSEELGWLGPYRLLEVLGIGGMGIVFLAEDDQLKRSVALKTMRPELAAIAANRQRFLREAQAAASIEHDHVIPIYHVGEDRGVPFLAMPLLKGETLGDRLRRDGGLALAETLRIGREIADGLAAAHERGLVHRDIKPGNIWLASPRGRVKILDFGLARFTCDLPELTRTGAIVGTPAYMSPEQARGRPIDHRTDLFSLGCVLYRLATGEPPFKGPDTIAILMALASDQPASPAALNPALPMAFSDLILALLEKDPARRPASARAVADAIEAIESRLPAAPSSPCPTELPTTAPGAVPEEEPRTAGRMSILPKLVIAYSVLIIVSYLMTGGRDPRSSPSHAYGFLVVLAGVSVVLGSAVLLARLANRFVVVPENEEMGDPEASGVTPVPESKRRSGGTSLFRELSWSAFSGLICLLLFHTAFVRFSGGTVDFTSAFLFMIWVVATLVSFGVRRRVAWSGKKKSDRDVSGWEVTKRKSRRFPGVAMIGLGCGATAIALILLCGVAAFLLATRLGPKIESFIEQTQARQVAWEEVARFWRPPPADAGPDQLFPVQVDQFRRESHDAGADIPELNIKASGHHAAYRAGAQHIEVFAYRASPLEKEALFKRAFEVVRIRKDESDDDFSIHSREDKDQPRPSYRESSGSPEGTRLSYRLGPPDQRGILWWDKGWLFVVRTRSGVDPESFLKLYLASFSSAPGAGGPVENSR